MRRVSNWCESCRQTKTRLKNKLEQNETETRPKTGNAEYSSELLIKLIRFILIALPDVKKRQIAQFMVKKLKLRICIYLDARFSYVVSFSSFTVHMYTLHASSIYNFLQ